VITMTHKQAVEAAKDLAGVGKGTRTRPTGLHYEPEELIRAMNYLADALNEGLVLNSGDGYFYGLRRRYGLLCCHDGGQIKGSLWRALEYVWKREERLEVLGWLADLDMPTALEDGYEPTCHLDEVKNAIFMAIGHACPDYVWKVKK